MAIMLSPAKIQAWLIAKAVWLVLGVSLMLGSYFLGVHHQYAKTSSQNARMLEKEIKLQQREHKVEAEEAEAAATNSAVLDSKLATSLGALQNAINKHPSPAACDLSDDELLQFNAIKATTER